MNASNFGDDWEGEGLWKAIAWLISFIVIIICLVSLIIWGIYNLVLSFTDVEAKYQPLPTQYVGSHIDPTQTYLCKDGTVSEVKHRIGACYGNGGIVTD